MVVFVQNQTGGGSATNGIQFINVVSNLTSTNMTGTNG